MSKGGESMPRYEYRSLRVSTEDTWNGNPGRKRGGDDPDRRLVLADSHLDDLVYFLDEKGDDLSDFEARAYVGLVDYLNGLGDDGWQVVVASPAVGRARLLAGDYLLMQTLRPQRLSQTRVSGVARTEAVYGGPAVSGPARA